METSVDVSIVESPAEMPGFFYYRDQGVFARAGVWLLSFLVSLRVMRGTIGEVCECGLIRVSSRGRFGKNAPCVAWI